MRGPWTTAEIEQFVRGHEVSVRDIASNPMAVPEWIALAATGVLSVSSSVMMAGVHPQERDVLMRVFLTALEQPGEIVEAAMRAKRDGDWFLERIQLVNLVDHDEVGGILGTMEREPIDDLGSPVLPEMDHAGEQTTVNWVVESLDSLGVILGVEGKVEEILGLTAPEAIGRRHTQFMHPDSLDDALVSWLNTMEQPGATRLSRRCFVHPDGTELWAECTFVNRMRPDGTGDILLIAYDVTERREHEKALRRSHEETRELANQYRHLAEAFRLVAEEVPAAVFRADPDGFVTFHNERWSQLPRSPEGTGRLRDIVHPADRAVVDLALATLAGGDGASRSFRVRSVGGDLILDVKCRAVIDPESDQRSVVGSVDDVTADVLLQQRADFDALTGLLNRASITERIAAALDERWDDVVVIFIDLDGFKGVNDTWGHDAGDTVLHELGHRFRQAVRPGDHVARYGGDEFVILVVGADHDGEESIMGRLADALLEPITWAGGSWVPGASTGWARAGADDDVVSLIRRADQAMFAEKHERRRRTARTA